MINESYSLLPPINKIIKAYTFFPAQEEPVASPSSMLTVAPILVIPFAHGPFSPANDA